ncbi:protein-tyrosine-phosphatase [Chryseolinea lacunae]|uniref:Protein-tyrosine-phosphatase n=1 Tax=Chryseolinea lacunae TaxID=2801331 RepID=A0ABS1L1M7_9BACT|nr:protein-tyrosine-phosphatase [Chryseolinea lacunae]MBL0745619.1 protein-tyrosine-phosphatase [Chryseolinea lacunae]
MAPGPTLRLDLQITIERLVTEFDRIPEARRAVLAPLTRFIQTKVDRKETVSLNFICTHNSRRSHMAQLWAQALAYYYNVPRVDCFSGGTEATAFHPNAVHALQKIGFDIQKINEDINPVYEVRISENTTAQPAFSKTYYDPFNPSHDFAAVMTCSNADDDCPFISGASVRIAVPYTDPKAFDGTPDALEKYSEKALEIGRELAYAFSQVVHPEIKAGNGQ